MKRFGVLLPIFFAFFCLIGSVNATECAEEFFTIFRMSNLSNAHIANWNFNNYETTLCLEDLHFDISGIDSESELESEMGLASGGLRKTRNNGENTVLRGYYENNTHASVPNYTGYPFNFSYGDLVCKWQLGGLCDQENSKWQFAVALTQTSNSHVSKDASSYNALGNSPIVCCYSESLISEEEGECGNGEKEADEQCDDDDFGTPAATCSDAGFDGGFLTCTGSCKISNSTCFNVDPSGGMCIQYGYNEATTQHEIQLDSETAIVPTLCSDYNRIEIFPEGYTLSSFKKEMCLSCSVVFNLAQRQFDQFQLDGYNPVCEWDENEEKCELGYQTAEGPCTIRVIEDAQCEPGQTEKTIKITNNCEVGCGLPEGCTTTVACPRTVQLPFFDLKNFISAIALIGLSYLAYHRMKK